MPASLTYRYMQRFRCLGPACDDSCCTAGWRIDVEPERYRRLRLLVHLDPVSQQRLASGFPQAPPNPVSRDKMTIHLDDSGACPFLEPDGWCWIHRRWGEEQLGDACALYPRHLRNIGDETVLSGSLSCPEIARLVLLADDALEAAEWSPGETVRERGVDTIAFDAGDPYHQWRQTIRHMVATLLQGEEPILFRLYRLLSFSVASRSFFYRGTLRFSAGRLTDLFDRFRDVDYTGRLQEKFSSLQVEASDAFVVVQAILTARQALPHYRRFADLLGSIEKSYEGDGYQANRPDFRQLMNLYAVRREQITTHTTVSLDHYFARYARFLWLDQFYGAWPNLAEYVYRVLLRMAMARFLFFSHPALHDRSRGLTQERVEQILINVIQPLSRTIDNHPQFLAALDTTLGKCGRDQPVSWLPLLMI